VTDGHAITVLVHGLWMHGVVMGMQRWYLARMGFDAMCYSYPSMRLTLTENAGRLAQFARSLRAPQVHWVGHSLGGLVILRMLEREPALPPGRVVLLGVPYGDGYARRALAASRLGTRLLGRSIGEWVDIEKPEKFPGREIGVIAGSLSRGLGRVVARGLPTPNDGVVMVVETELAAACDRIVLPVSHSGMLFSRRVARQSGAFLRDGKFDNQAGMS